MKILIKILVGVLAGLLYGFVNFCLVTPIMRENIMAVLFWGVQGGIFSSFYVTFSVLLPARKKFNYYIPMLIGGVCGFLSSLLNIFLSLKGFNQTNSVEGIIVLPGVSKKINFDLFYYAVGCIVVGAIAVLFVELIIERRKKATDE